MSYIPYRTINDLDTNQIFAMQPMLKKQIDHVKDFMPIMEELVKSVKQLQEELVEVKTRLRRLELLSKYRDWITRLRSIMVRKMNERNKKFNIMNQEFKNWVEVAEMLLVEADTKVLYEEKGERYEQTCTNLLVNVLKDFDLKKSNFNQLLLMYDESIFGFPNKKTTLADLPYAQVELAGTTFPESMADYKKLLEKALNAIGIWKKEFVIKDDFSKSDDKLREPVDANGHVTNEGMEGTYKGLSQKEIAGEVPVSAEEIEIYNKRVNKEELCRGTISSEGSEDSSESENGETILEGKKQ
ncbi:15774_t:CDS:2 [Rhizophagus irregularis]|nr:15774_t:CDS:2 [Rhizophagus irregularis]